MLTVDEVRRQLAELCPPPPPAEGVALSELTGRVLATDAVSPIHSPPHDNAQMDGYALRCDDWQEGKTFSVSQVCAAGARVSPLALGTVARIYTGALIPKGADCIIRQEAAVQQTNGQILFATAPERGRYIRHTGHDVRAGEIVLNRGQCVEAERLAFLASVGIAEAQVYRRLAITVLTTGDELTEPGMPLQEGGIYNSNRYLLCQTLEQSGFTVRYAHLKDDPSLIVSALQDAARSSDFVITTGGASVGDRDYMHKAVETIGNVLSWRVRMKPGKPVIIGRIGSSVYLGLPGNPVSAFASLHVLVLPFLRKAQGQRAERQEHFARAAFAWQGGDRREFLRGRAYNQNGVIHVAAHKKQDSSALSAAAWANVLIEIPEEQAVAVGDTLRIHYLISGLNE